ncbi:type II/IV secretion system protein [Patescibacteria group bacterium]
MALFTKKSPDLMSQSKNIVKLMLAQKLINPQVGDYLLSKSLKTGINVGEIAYKERILPENNLGEIYAKYLKLPFIDLKNLDIPYEAVSRIPKSIAEEHLIISFESKGNLVKLAVADPYRLQSIKSGVIQNLKKEKNIDVKLYITTREAVRYAMKSYSKPQTSDKPLPEKIFDEQPKPQTNPIQGTILEFMQKRNLISEEKIQTILENSKSSGKSIELIIRELNIIQPDEFVRIQASYLDLPYVFLRVLDIPEKVLFKLPHDIAKKYRMIIFDVIAGKILKIASSQPENPQVKEVLDFIKKKNDVEIDLFVTTEADIDYSLARYQDYLNQKKTKQAIAKPKKPEGEAGDEQESDIQITHTFETEAEAEKSKENDEIGGIDLNLLVRQDITSVDQLKKIVQTKSVPKIVAGIINYSLNLKSSDIHIEPLEKKTQVRFRIDGVLHDIVETPSDLHAAIISRIKISAKLRLDEQRIPQDGRFDVKLKNKEVDLRVSTLPTVHGEKAVMRLLDKSQSIFSLPKLGVEGKALKVLSENIKKPYGMILSTGPTGSGKSTSLYAILQTINSSEINIITLEDPVEYDIEGVNQCQAKPQIGFSFAEGLRSVLRQDPDVILVGEIRDKETAGMAIHSALTGHLVLSTLHTNDAAGAAPRLIDMGIEPFLIISSTNIFIAQRLVRKICDSCKQEVTPPEGVLADIEKELSSISQKSEVTIQKPYKFYRGKGCSNCSNTGYTGRIGIFEVLPLSENIGRLIAKRAPGSEIKKQAIEEGMLTMIQDGLIKSLKGLTTIDEVLRVTSV